MKKIKFVDPLVGKFEKVHLNRALKSGWLSFGPFVENFENKISKFMKVKNCISVNNGTNAMLLILMYLNLKKGDEVIVPSFCYISPIHMLKLMGLVPIPVDISLDNLQIDTNEINKKISKKTKAILLIHNYGTICNLQKVKKIAQKRDLFIIEDISEVLFSKQNKNFVGDCYWYKKEKIISYASLHASKTITAGEGGIILTNSKKISSKLKILRNHGQKSKRPYFYEMTGGNFRLSNLLASIGYSQLLRLNSIINKRKVIDNFYKKKLSQNSYFSLMKEPLNFKSIKFGFPLLFKKKRHKENIMKILNKDSTLSRPGFYTLNKLKHLNIYKNNLTFKKDFINSEIATNNVLVLPMHNKLKMNDINEICIKILSYFKNIKR
jgi:perosamine synthetase